MRLIRRLFLLVCLAATCTAVWAAIYARREGFSESWKNAIELEFAKRGYHVDIGKLTLGAFRGLVAEDVRFFQDASRSEEVAYLDDVYLDVDLNRILNKEISINTLDVQKARLSLPLDPARPRRLHVNDLSGRIVITESVIEIVKAEATVAGVDLEVKGSLVRPPLGAAKDPERDPRKGESAFNERRRQFLRFLREFETFEFGEEHPHVVIEFRGDLDDLATLTASARVSASAFRKQGQPYQVRSLDAQLRFDGRENRADITRLSVRDEKGFFELTGHWIQKENRLDFTATSTADIAGLTGLFWNDRKLGEVVFFTPPMIEASGHLDFNHFRSPLTGFPGEVLGEVRAERFVTRGTVFSGAKFGFHLANERFYLRNLRLDHKTGVAFLNLKYEPGNGGQTLQYETEIKLDPLVFRPFFDERGRKIIDSWNFGETSSIYIAAVGQGETWKFATWKNRGVIDLRQFRLNGVDFLELETDYESDGNTQWFRNISLARREGKIVAEVAENDRVARTWDLKGVVSTVDPVEGARAFNAKLSKALEKYRHQSPPTLRLAGRLDGRRNEEVGDQPRHNDLTVSFSGGGDAQYDFLGKTLTLTDPAGEVRISGSRVHLTRLTAAVFGGTVDMRYDVENVRIPDSPFQMHAALRHMPLERVMRHYVEKDDIIGSVDLDLDLSGRVGQIATFQGGGNARISDGYLFAIPLLGPLGALLPGADRTNNGGPGNIAKEASATFRIENGILSTRDLEALTRAFRVKAAGTVSLIDQSVDLEAVVNTRGELSSTVLTPVSELLTYSCTGTVREPVWKPKHISNLAKVPATLISELTNIPVEGLKKLGQIGQELFALPERVLNPPASPPPASETSPPETAAPASPAHERRFPWGGRGRTGENGTSPAPRKWFPLLPN